MRIISNFKDYYDCIQGVGQDQGLLYLRNSFEQPYYGRSMPFGDFNRFTVSSCLSYKIYVVGFCGKVYPVLDFVLQRPFLSTIRKICFNMDEVEDFMLSNLKKKEYIAYSGKDYWKSRLLSCNKEFFKKFWQSWEGKQDSYQYMFDDAKSPIFVANYGHHSNDPERKIVYNACLKDIEFFRVIEPYTAFQELSMYWGNVAQPNRPIPEVSDEDLLEAKGFDPVWSFRKEPSKKR